MATLDTGLLALIIFLILCICGLFFIGVYSIRRGLSSTGQIPAGSESIPPRWHEQPKVLFGLNNITFALLLLGILFLSLFTSPTIHYVLFGFIGLLLIVSITLVVRTMRASLAMVRQLQTKPKTDEP
jgi:hypothetical protein